MKLDSLDQLVEFLSYKNLKISDLDIQVSTEESIPSSVNESVNKDSVSVENMSYPSHNGGTGVITNLNGNPSISIEEGQDNIIYVKNFESIPNSCHMGKINLLERELYAGICTENEASKINLSVQYQRDGQTITVERAFKLEKVEENQEEKIVLNISE